MKKRLTLISLTLALLIILASLAAFTSPPAHRVFINANIITADAENQIAEAVSIRGEIIEAVGNNQQISRLISADTQITDLQGKTLLPGFIDAHSHFPTSGLTAISADISPPPMGNVDNITQLLARLRQQADITPAGKWVVGFGYDDSSLEEQRHPTRQELDSISNQHPIYLWHSSGHMGIANSMALDKVGIRQNSTAPVGGIIGKDPNTGKLNGLLQEKSALSLSTLLNDFSLLDYYKIFQQARDEYVQNGITTAQSGGVGLKLTQALYWASELRLLPFRIVVFPRHEGLGQQLLKGEYTQADFNTEQFHLGPVKIVADGSVQGRTAFLTKAFYTNPSTALSYRGFPAFEQPILTDLVNRYHKAGFQLAIHGNGDAAIDNILTAFADAQSDFPVSDPRFILIHAQMARQDQLERMQSLGITPSFFPTHTFFWGDQHLAKLMGPQRAAMMSPTGSATKLGLRFSVHTDAPVTPINPLQLLWSTVNRESMSGAMIGSDQRISVMQAIRAMTIDAAWQVFQEKNRGSIEVGKFADLVILSGDPLESPRNIRQLEVLETIVAGVSVYQAKTKQTRR
ncbi:amidohydrolase [Neptunomonas qingdaonensis]|uniref:Amidohydrolase 3 domain-containing protein n=1 Tax=Neptunomonas qingdaonensis TaxID=1045558 RepID=A0A1I2V8H5_9GAMM|nr:amidohydrolase [Neptunomonas qingdaonensis]SFG84497.1 hypothetical protein SAMN05216175_11573 [Neptunomonas qingdaonensis]